MIRFRTVDLWPCITALAKAATTAAVAVAYCTSAKLLPLPAGSLLVVDFSLAAIKGGRTNPAEVLKLIKRGVEVHSVENLHAKVFVFDNRVITGSSNASASSTFGLVEAAIETDHPGTVNAARAFVASLRGDHVGPSHARSMIKHWEPSRNRYLVPRPILDDVDAVPVQSPIWIVHLEWCAWDEDDHRKAATSRPKAREELKNKSDFALDEFAWQGKDFYTRLEVNTRVLPIELNSPAKRYVVAPCRVLRITRWRRGRTYRCVVFLERPNNTRRISLERVCRQLGSAGDRLMKAVEKPQLLQERHLIHAVSKLWPTTG